MKKELEIGAKFGKLIVVEYLGSVNYNNTYLCECECGKNRKVKLTLLLQNKILHCGCEKHIQNSHGNKKFNPEEASFRAKASNYKSHSKRRKINFELSIDETVCLLKGNCFYCKSQPSNVYNVRLQNRKGNKNKNCYVTNKAEDYKILYSGIDRKDNNKGYTLENSVSCCTQCNTAKLNFTTEQFIEWIEKVYLNFTKNDKE